MSDAVKTWIAGSSAALVLLLSGASVGWVVNGWRLSADLAEARQARSDDAAASAQSSLADFVANASKVKAAADAYVSERGAFDAKLDQISKDLKSYAKEKPLPVDCRPDAGRVRSLAEAVAAAKQAAARQ